MRERERREGEKRRKRDGDGERERDGDGKRKTERGSKNPYFKCILWYRFDINRLSLPTSGLGGL